jgi:hypothetical protein
VEKNGAANEEQRNAPDVEQQVELTRVAAANHIHHTSHARAAGRVLTMRIVLVKPLAERSAREGV